MTDDWPQSDRDLFAGFVLGTRLFSAVHDLDPGDWAQSFALLREIAESKTTIVAELEYSSVDITNRLIAQDREDAQRILDFI